MPKAIPSICVLVVKNNKDGKSLSSKSRIVILGNFEDQLHQKSQRYAPVLKYNYLRLITAKSVGNKRILYKGYCKNAFCNATLIYGEVTGIRPPIGNSDFQDDEYWLLKKLLYGLCKSPHYWYNMIKVILLSMGINPSPRDPYLISGVHTKPSYPIFTSDLQSKLHAGLYVNNFVFYSSYPSQEDPFKTLLQDHIQVDFMVNVDYLLGTAFTWIQHADGNI